MNKDLTKKNSKGHLEIILYLLLAHRKLKATFLPRHKNCLNAIGPQEKSAETILEKARSGKFNLCFNCNEPIEDEEDINIEMIFWKPGTDAR